MTTSLLSERSAALPLGAQRPRLCSVPAYSSSAGDEAIAFARLAGLELDEWQQFVLRESLGERSDGKWSAPTVGLVVGRQNGKNAILEARELAGLFLFGEKLIIHSAHEQKTATEHFRRVLNRIRKTPQLKRRLVKSISGKGSEGIELDNGARIFFATRTGGGGRGLTVDLMVYDEAMHLTEDERSALTPTMAAQSMHGNTQTWYTGSAVDQQNPKHDGRPLAQVRERGIQRAGRVAYFEWSAPGDDPATVAEDVASDPESWALANPGLGVRISHEWVEHERTVEMGPRGFRVERLSIGDWPDTSEDAGRKISRAAWLSTLDTMSRRSGPAALAFAVSEDGASAAIGFAGQRADGKWHGEVIQHAPGTAWVLPRLAEIAKGMKPLAVLYQASTPAASLVAEAGNLKIRRLESVSTSDTAAACGTFFTAVSDGEFKRGPQPALDSAVDGAQEKSSGDGLWLWSLKDSTSDITPLQVVTLATWAAMGRKKKRAGVVDLAAALAAAEAAEQS